MNMWAGLDFGSAGYAEEIKQKLIKGASEHSYLHPYDYMAIVSQADNLPGFSLIGNTATIELDIDHPLGFGNHFVTELHRSGGTRQGQPSFQLKYPDEEFFGYSTDEGDGYLLTEDGELIVID